MDLKVPTEEEELARSLVEPLIEGKLIHVDPPDFLICRDGQSVGGLEVTIAVPTEYARLGGQLGKFGEYIESPLLEGTWDARLDADRANLARWDYERVAMLVRAIEQTGLVDSRQLRNEALRRELESHGIVHVYRLTLRRGGVQRIYLNPAGWAGAVSGAAVDVLIEDRAEFKRQQLSAIEGDSHLFIWVAFGTWPAAAALKDEPSTDPPPLPDFLDTVWVAPLFGIITSIWRRRQGWEILRTG